MPEPEREFFVVELVSPGNRERWHLKTTEDREAALRTGREMIAYAQDVRQFATVRVLRCVAVEEVWKGEV